MGCRTNRFYGRYEERVVLVVVAYDIPNDRRRAKLSKFLEGYGKRVQYSVFECFLSLEEMRKLHVEVTKRVKPEEDKVRLYWLPSRAVEQVQWIGGAEPEPPPQAYIL